MAERLINAEALFEDDWEASIRPIILNDFIGQQPLRENLLVYINAAKKTSRSA